MVAKLPNPEEIEYGAAADDGDYCHELAMPLRSSAPASGM